MDNLVLHFQILDLKRKIFMNSQLKDTKKNKKNKKKNIKTHINVKSIYSSFHSESKKIIYIYFKQIYRF